MGSKLDSPTPDKKVNFQSPSNCVLPRYIENSLISQESNMRKSHFSQRFHFEGDATTVSVWVFSSKRRGIRHISQIRKPNRCLSRNVFQVSTQPNFPDTKCTDGAYQSLQTHYENFWTIRDQSYINQLN